MRIDRSVVWVLASCCAATGAVHASLVVLEPPTPREIAGEVRAMRSLFDHLQVSYHVERRAYVDGTSEIRTLRSQSTLSARDLVRRLDTTSYGWDQPLGVGPSRSGAAIYDGRDTFAVVPRTARSTRPGTPVMVKPGLAEDLLPAAPTVNFEAALWSDMLRPLDVAIESGDYAVTVSPRPEIIDGRETWPIVLRHDAGDGPVVAEVWTVHVAPSLGMLPVRSTCEFLNADGSVRFVSGKSARGFEEVRPGLWIAREIVFGDPRDANPATATTLRVDAIAESPDREVLLAEVESGPRDMIDLRSNERYLIEDGQRGPATRIENIAAATRELDRFYAAGAEVHNAQLPTPAAAPGRGAAVFGMAGGLAAIGIGFAVLRRR